LSGMVLAMTGRRIQRKACPSFILSTTIPHRWSSAHTGLSAIKCRKQIAWITTGPNFVFYCTPFYVIISFWGEMTILLGINAN